MNGKTVRLVVAALVVWPVCCAAQTAGAPGPSGVPQKQIDIGAAEAPLSDTERTDLDKAVRKHDYPAEKAVIDGARAEHPDSFDLLVMWGRLAYLEKQPKDAADALERADKIKALSEPDRMTLAIAYQFSEKPAQSRDEFLKLAKLAPTNAQYLYLLGRMDRANQRVEEAVDNFTKAIRIDPNSVRAYEELGQIQEALGHKDEARKTYATGAAINRRLSVHWEWSPLDLGIVFLRDLDFAEAEKLFREALQYNPRFAWGHYYMGQLFYKQDRNREAIDEYKAAVVDDPQLRQAWFALGQEFKYQGKEVEANRALAIFKKLEDQQNAAERRKYSLSPRR
jgi:tetratricopeptide (TPR) repeat protein